MSNQGSKTPLRVSSDEWAEFVNNGESLLKERTMFKPEENYKYLQRVADEEMRVHGEMSQPHVSALMLAADAYKQYLKSLYGSDNA